MTLAGVLFIVAAWLTWMAWTDPRIVPLGGGDFTIYRDAAARWLDGGPFYLPDQLSGPYTAVVGHVMYPPIGLVLFVPFVFAPNVLWWAIPLGVIGWSVWRMRPNPWGWIGIAACLAFPQTVQLIHAGNPVLWIAAAFSLSFRWPWVGALVLLKPSLFPFAFGGVRTRQWWVGIGALAAVSLAFLPMWFDWIAVMLNARGQFSGPLYSLQDVPLMLIPLVAWRARTGAAPSGGSSRRP
jgi:hypothetical protein